MGTVLKMKKVFGARTSPLFYTFDTLPGVNS